MLLAVACDAGANVATVVRRDSAGIQIVENTAAAWTDEDRWVIEPEPFLTIGSRDGDSPAAFALLGGAFRDASGRFIVLDAGARELRFFAPDGSFLHAAGRPGEGPGEFPALYRLSPAPLYGLRIVMPWQGDSIAVAGMNVGMLQVLDADGIEGRRVRDPALMRWAQGVRSGERLLLSYSGGRPAVEPADGWQRDVLLAFNADGSIDTLGVFRRRPETTVLFGPYLFSLPLEDGFITGMSDRAQLNHHDWNGSLRRIVRLPIEADPVPDSILSAGRESAEVLPVACHFACDREGYIWFTGCPAELYAPAESLHVVAPDGTYLGDVDLPPDFHPLDIGSDWIMGVWRDELDVEYLRVHALQRGG